MKYEMQRMVYRLGIFLLVLIGGVISFITLVNAFTGPTTSGGLGSGGIGVNSSNNVSFGTSNTASNTRAYIYSTATPTNSKYGISIVSPTSTRFFFVRNDGKVGINTSSVYSTARLTVQGDIFANNFFSGGTNPYTGFIGAENVATGAFGCAIDPVACLTYRYTFPSSLGVSSTVTSTLPQPLSVYGSAYASNGLLVATNAFSTSTKMEVSEAPLGPAGIALRIGKGGDSINFLPERFVFSPPPTNFAQINATHPWGLAIGSSVAAPYLLLVTTSSGSYVNASSAVLGQVNSYKLDVVNSFRATNGGTVTGKFGINTTSTLTTTSTLDVVGVAPGTSKSAVATDFCVINATTNKCVSALGPSGGEKDYLALWKTSASVGTSTLQETTSTFEVSMGLKVATTSVFQITNGYFLAMRQSGATGGDIPTVPTSRKEWLMWVPRQKGHFLAGEVLGNAWDDLPSSHGVYAFGYNNRPDRSSGLSVLFGDSNWAKSVDTFLAGSGNVVDGDRGAAVGLNNSVLGTGGFVYGRNNTAGSRSSLSFVGGANNLADDQQSFAVGSSTNAEGKGNNTVAFGDSTTAHGGSSVVGGLGSVASGTAAVALGNAARAAPTANSGVAIGAGAFASGGNSVAFGGDGINIPQATGNQSVVFGTSLAVGDDNSVGFGLGNGSYSVPSYGGANNDLIIAGGNFGIGVASPQGVLEVAGPITQDATILGQLNSSINATDPEAIYFVDTTLTVAASINVRLPYASQSIGRTYYIYKADALSKPVSFGTNLGDLIVTPAATSTLTSQGQGVEATAIDATTWLVVPFGP